MRARSRAALEKVLDRMSVVGLESLKHSLQTANVCVNLEDPAFHRACANKHSQEACGDVLDSPHTFSHGKSAALRMLAGTERLHIGCHWVPGCGVGLYRGVLPKRLQAKTCALCDGIGTYILRCQGNSRASMSLLVHGLLRAGPDRGWTCMEESSTTNSSG